MPEYELTDADIAQMLEELAQADSDWNNSMIGF